jgi:hypothetical protein
VIFYLPGRGRSAYVNKEAYLSLGFLESNLRKGKLSVQEEKKEFLAHGMSG